MTREARKTQITHLLANPSLTHREIAVTVGCSTKTVQRVAKKIQPVVSEADAKVQEYQRQLRKRLPIEKRVTALLEVAAAKQNPFARLRALERIDALDGIVLKTQEPEAMREPRPVFILPPTANVQVNLYSHGPNHKEVDVTPETERKRTGG